MENFEVVNPTRIVFGKNQLNRLPELLKEINVTKVLITYGGQSAEKIGLLDNIRKVLTDFSIVEFGGIEANPEYTTLMSAALVGQKEK